MGMWLCEGFTDRIQLSVQTSQEGGPQRLVRITGSDTGKLLAKHTPGWKVQVSETNTGGDEMIAAMNAGILFLSGSPDLMCKQIVEAYFTSADQLAAWKDRFDFKFSSKDDWEIYERSLTAWSGTVWSQLQTFSNDPWNILYTETNTSGKLSVILEKSPFNSIGFLELPETRKREVRTEDLIRYEIGVDDTQRVNHLFYRANLPLIGSEGDTLRLVNLTKQDTDSIQMYGASIFEPQTNYFPPGTNPVLAVEENFTNLYQPLKERTETLWNWYRKNHMYESGTFEIKGDPTHRVCNMLYHVDRKYEYLIEQVNHTFNFGIRPSYTTSLGVTRGQRSSST